MPDTQQINKSAPAPASPGATGASGQAARETPGGFPRPPRDWLAIALAGLPGLAACIGLFFTNQSVQANIGQIRVNEQSQVAASYSAAVSNLASGSPDKRTGAIYVLQQLMQDFPREQNAVVAVLCTFIREHAPLNGPNPPIPDVQIALDVIGTRNTAHDTPATKIDLSNTQLSGVQLPDEDFSNANLAYAQLKLANLTHVNFDGANLVSTYFEWAKLSWAIFTHAALTDTDLAYTRLNHANLAHTTPNGAALFKVDLTDANLTGTNLTDVDTRFSTTSGANFTNANLTHTWITPNEFTHAINANLTKARLYEGP